MTLFRTLIFTYQQLQENLGKLGFCFSLIMYTVHCEGLTQNQLSWKYLTYTKQCVLFGHTQIVYCLPLYCLLAFCQQSQITVQCIPTVQCGAVRRGGNTTHQSTSRNAFYSFFQKARTSALCESLDGI